MDSFQVHSSSKPIIKPLQKFHTHTAIHVFTDIVQFKSAYQHENYILTFNSIDVS